MPDYFDYVVRPNPAAADVIDGRLIKLGQGAEILLESLILRIPAIAVGVIDGQIFPPILFKVESVRIAQFHNPRRAPILQVSVHAVPGGLAPAVVIAAIEFVVMPDVLPADAISSCLNIVHIVKALVIVDPVDGAEVRVAARRLVGA